jgi:glycosidase
MKSNQYKIQRTARRFLDVGVGYQVFVPSFADGNGDGFGDIRGIIDNLDYIASLSVRALWLTPIHAAHSYHMYDVMDYYAIDQRVGSLADLQELIDVAAKRGIGIIMDLVVNHTSHLHPWFVAACADDAQYKDWYHFDNARANIAGWHALVGTNKQYYGFFADTMPDLNFDHAPVRQAMIDVALYWLKLGVAGLRLDACKHIYNNGEGTVRQGDIIVDHVNQTKNVQFWLEFNAGIKKQYPDAILIGENMTTDARTLAPYYQALDSQFDFPMYAAFGKIFDSDGDGASMLAQLHHSNLIDWTTQRADSVIDSPLTSNHDVIRLLNHVSGRGEHDSGIERGSQQDLLCRKRCQVAALTVLTLPGISWIYAGDELGMHGYKCANTTPPLSLHHDQYYHADRWLRQPFMWEGARAKYITSYSFVDKAIQLDDYNATLEGVCRQAQDARSMYSQVAAFAAICARSVMTKGTYTPIPSHPSVFAFEREHEGIQYRVYHNYSARTLGVQELQLPSACTLVVASHGATLSQLPGFASIIVQV